MSYRIISWSLIVFACFYGLGGYPLLDHNEGMYAAIARDMLRSGNFIIPHLNGVPYIEKPPLLYWLTAAAMSVFGVNEWSARLVPALALFVTAWKLQRFLTRAGKSEMVSMTAPLIMTTSIPLLALGRMVLCDMLLTCLLTMSFIFFYEWYAGLHRPGKGHKFLMGFYACLALAVMAKGFVAIILAGGSIAVFLLWQRTPRHLWLKPLSASGVLLFFCITVPWHIAATVKEPGFAYFYFINEHLLRFLNMRQPHDYYTGHFWYYLVRIPAYLIPWTLLLFIFARKEARSQMSPDPLHRFLWSWFLFCLVFFSASGAKANYYMIAGMPPLVMLMALQLERLMTKDPMFIRGLITIALVLIVTTVELARYLCNEKHGDLYPVCEVVSWHIIILTCLYILISILLCRRAEPRWLMPLLASNVLLLLPLLISGVDTAGERVSQKRVAEFIEVAGGKAAIYQEFEELSALAFYLDAPLTIVNSQSSDLLYGQKQLPPGNPYFIKLDQWMEQKHPMPLVVLNKRFGSFMSEVGALHRHACVEERFERVSVISRCY